MGQNLGPLNIKDSYQGLVQISGSILTNGTGSDITSLEVTASHATQAVSASFASSAASADSATSATSASFATTASFALNAGGNETGSLLTTASISDAQITFTKGDASTFDITVNNVVSANSASYVAGANVDGAVSNATSASLATEVNVASDATNATRYVGFVDTLNGKDNVRVDSTLTFNPFSNVLAATGFSGNLTGNVTGNADTATTASHADNAASADTATSASYATTASHAAVAADLSSAAALNISSITASVASFVTASITNLTTITGSIVEIGDAFVVLNTATPTSRYAGIQVEDSGSAPENYTASFFFDAETNDWNYEYSGSDPTNFGVAMFGPEYGTKGSPVYPTNNRILKGDGGHHVVDSSITDDGSTVSFTAELDVTGGVTASAGFNGDVTGDLEGTASFATTASHALNATTPTLDEVLTEGSSSTSNILLSSRTYSGTTISSGLSAQTYSIVGGSTTSDLILTGNNASSNKILLDGGAGEVQISGSTKVSMSFDVTGTSTLEDVVVSGSVAGEVSELSISSQTASMDLSTGNFFSLTLVSGSDTHLDVSNIQPGSTVNLQVFQPTTATDSHGTLSFSSEVKFVDGTAFEPTAVSGSEDVMTFIAFRSTALLGTGLKNFS